jgi:CRISPR-associated endonuclease/helicase Cas3
MTKQLELRFQAGPKDPPPASHAPAEAALSQSESFAEWFSQVHKQQAFPWQATLGNQADPGFRLIQIPTGFGKTLGVLSAWLYHRVVKGSESWPRRLVWMLPMRTLVEQTQYECRRVLEGLGLFWDGSQPHRGRVGVHVLMGGADAGAFHLHPEECAVIIGTQDMLLSRALNRGYGAARGRWPQDFGLLSVDTLWVLDEVQLMGVGLATALQLAWLRDDSASPLRQSFTWSMSATLQRDWLHFSPEAERLSQKTSHVGLVREDEALPLFATTKKTIARIPPRECEALAQVILEEAQEAPGLTLVVLNSVARAVEVFQHLRRQSSESHRIHLVHSRFRGKERREFQALLHETSRGSQPVDAAGNEKTGERMRSAIIVSTQVVEAGVDLSADVLITEICPWPSLIQRLGRLARRGGCGRALVVGLDLDKQSGPYRSEDLEAAWDVLASLDDASPRTLMAFERAHRELAARLYPFEPSHVLLEDDVIDLFDTTPDLTGGDIDVSRFIRDGDERDVSIAWIALAHNDRGHAIAPKPDVRPVSDALCTVPFLMAQEWLCGKKSGGVLPKNLRKGVDAFVWDYLDGIWRRAERRDIRPGAQVLVSATVGGYDPESGFAPGSTKGVTPVPFGHASAQERSDSAEEDDTLSAAAWQTIAFHGAAVAQCRSVSGILLMSSTPYPRFDRGFVCSCSS